MTNTEAIETLRANYPDACYGQLREAVDAAIETLSKDINVTNTDCISKQPKQEIEFVRLMIRNDLNGKPYCSIIYLEFDDNGVGHEYEGYASYSLDVVSDYLKKYFMSSAQLEQQWIPCSEMLPEIDELVLVTDDSGGIKTVDVDRCGQYEDSNERFWYCTQNAVAWMPLPKPY